MKKEISYAIHMLNNAFRILSFLRLVALVSAVSKGLILVASALGVAYYSTEEMGLKILTVLSSTPVFALAMLVCGQWLGEWFDSLFYRIEGGMGGASARYLRFRLGFTRRLITKPAWYRNEDRISREVARTNRAMSAAGFANVGSWHPDDAVGIQQRAEYLRACSALIKKLGVRKAGNTDS